MSQRNTRPRFAEKAPKLPAFSPNTILYGRLALAAVLLILGAFVFKNQIVRYILLVLSAIASGFDLGLKAFDKPAPVTTVELQPAEVRIPLSQHVGAPCTPLVKAGETVSVGQMIGQIPEKALGAPIHASISGQVTEVTDKYIAIRRV